MKRTSLLTFFALLFFCVSPRTTYAALAKTDQVKVEPVRDKRIQRKQKKIKRKLERWSKKKRGNFILLPLKLLSIVLLLTTGITGSGLIGLLFFNALSLVGFFFSRKKGTPKDVKLGNTLLITSILINLVVVALTPFILGP